MDNIIFVQNYIMLRSFSIQQIKQLQELLQSLSSEQFSSFKDPVFGSSIGKHTRHIIEFYISFFDFYEKEIPLSYDDRKRVAEFETNLKLANEQLDIISKKLSENFEEKEAVLKYQIHQKTFYTKTSISRELNYLNEHTTHHIALIRMILSQLDVDANKFGSLGVAYSTPK